jgi:large subunit ribosomal protein L18
MASLTTKNPRQRRHERVRKKVEGTKERSRLCVFRSLRFIYAQVIDDSSGQTIASAGSLDADVKKLGGKSKVEQSKVVGKVLAERAIAKGISNVVFDRGGYLYHGRVKALADAAREAGLKF